MASGGHELAASASRHQPLVLGHFVAHWRQIKDLAHLFHLALQASPQTSQRTWSDCSTCSSVLPACLSCSSLRRWLDWRNDLGLWAYSTHRWTAACSNWCCSTPAAPGTPAVPPPSPRAPSSTSPTAPPAPASAHATAQAGRAAPPCSRCVVA